MKHLVRGRRRVAVSTAILAAVAACAVPAALGARAAAAPFVIGVPTQLTGSFGYIGTGLQQGLSAYISYANSHGGIAGRKIQVVSVDDQANPANTVAAVKQLAEQQHVIAIAAAGITTTQNAIKPLLVQYQIPMLTFLGTIKEILNTSNDPNDWTYVTGVPTAGSVTPQAVAAKKLLGGASGPVVLLDATTGAGAEHEAAFQTVAKRRNIDVVSVVHVLSTQTDYTTAAQQALSKNPKVIVIGLGDTGATAFDLAVRSLGSKVPVINYTGGSALSTLQALKDPFFYVIRGMAYSTDKSAGTKLYDSILKKAKVDPDAPFVSDGYAQGITLVAALKKCGPKCTGPGLRAALDKLKFPTNGLTPAAMRFMPQIHQNVTVASVWHLVNGKPVKVYDKIYALPPAP
jgi:branched-chain amino acid transport system substrate-binding protein